MPLVFILSFSPLLRAQARLLNSACLRMLFFGNNLRQHLAVQRAFHLMGDGVFISRLSAALFDPSSSSTERQKGIIRSGTNMGLKLGDRSNWPPASSELRLAMMGILADCWAASSDNMSLKTEKSKRPTLASSKSDLPGSLSFAIRNLPEEEMHKIMDSSSIHAMDFLRLQYTPPSPIDAVIDQEALVKYDSIFRLLLLMIRMVFAVSHLPRLTSSTAMGFSLQCRHFVNAITDYFYKSGIGEHWNGFMAHVENIESELRKEDDEDATSPLKDFGGIEELRRKHDECLDAMLFGLFLRHRQQKVMEVLERILDTILQFEKLCRSQGINDQEVARLKGSFTTNFVLFLDVCKGLVGKRGYGSAKNREGATLDRLISALDWNGFYTSQRQ
jgi:hypothetical protein